MAALLQEFLGALSTLVGRPERVSELLCQASFSRADLEKYVFFRDGLYTRNLIYSDQHWEVLTLCWQQGQQTPIHDHNGSRGWVYMVEGSLEERLFRLSSPGNSKAAVLSQQGESRLPYRGIGYIDDQIGCHSLTNTSASNSISLHIYSPRIASCRYYSLGSSASQMKSLCYYSQGGAVLPPPLTSLTATS